MSKCRTASQGPGAIFAAPSLIALLSLVALIVGLTGDGWRDAISWAGLVVPVLTVAWAMKARRT